MTFRGEESFQAFAQRVGEETVRQMNRRLMKAPRASLWKRFLWLIREKRPHWWQVLGGTLRAAHRRVYWRKRLAEWRSEHRYWG